MKRRLIALLLVAFTLSLCLVSCGEAPLEGTYVCTVHDKGAEPTEYTFKRSKVTYEINAPNGASTVIKGKYKIEDGKISLEYDGENSFYNAVRKIEIGEDFIKIDGVKYIKK